MGIGNGLGVIVLGLGLTPAASAAVLSGPIVNAANGHTYYLLGENTWTGSEAEAVTLGGHLVTINDADEQAWVYSTFTALPVIEDRFDDLWIGLNDAEQEGTFTWISGEAVTYTNWFPGGSPDDLNGQDYAYMNSPAMDGGTWDDNGGVAQIYGVVEVVPEPATAALLAGGAGLLLRRRRMP